MTELIWQGKYNREGKKNAPVRIALPFQTIETVNESAQDRLRTLDLFAQGRPTEWRNRLIWGDKKYVLPSLLPEFAGKVNLIYIDPPFDTGADFSFTATIPGAPPSPPSPHAGRAGVGYEEGPGEVEDETTSFIKQPSIIEQKAYRDTWGRGLDSYLQWFYETAVLLRELLAEDGSIYVHVGWQVAHYVKAMLDEIFGYENFRNEIVWKRTPHAGSSKARSKRFPINHESIFWYSKNENYVYQSLYIPFDDKYIQRFKNPDNDPRGPWQSVSLKTYSNKTFEKLKAENKLIPSQRQGARWRYKWFLSETQGKQVEDIWIDIYAINSMAEERTTYPTQKPEALLERIIKASSNEGDLVLDCFCVRAGTGVLAPLESAEPGKISSSISPHEAISPLSPPARGGIQGLPTAHGGKQDCLPAHDNSLPVCGEGRGGVKITAIEMLNPGDLVCSHDGQPHRVIRTVQRKYRGKMIGIRHESSGEMLWVTADHRILTKVRDYTFTGRANWSHNPSSSFEKARALRKEMTRAERLLWSKLRNRQLGVKFRRQHPIGPYIVDFHCPERALIIEVDGDSHFTADAIEYDRERTRYLQGAGLQVIRFTNSEVYHSFESVLREIQKNIGEPEADFPVAAVWLEARYLQKEDVVFFGIDRNPVKIVEIKVEETEETVYDLEVEDSHSYLTEFCAVHNCGSGTTAAVAEKLNRRWIACDLGRFAIHTTRKRLLGIPGVKPFVVQNLGKYERQQWMGAEFESAETRANVEQQYRHFILQLYHADPISGYTWLHGVKAGRMIHVGSVEAPVSVGDVKNIVQEFWKSVGKPIDPTPALPAPHPGPPRMRGGWGGGPGVRVNGIDVLGWDFAFELNETAKQFAAANKVDLKFKKIPREVLEKKAVEQGDIRFFELASLTVDVKVKAKQVTIELADFIVPPDDVPEEVRRSITHWSQWIDYWAVDWEYKDDTFHNEWQSYRTKKDPGIELRTRRKHKEIGKYNVVIKVIDILGNDTTKMIEVEVK